MLTDGLEWCGLLWCFYQLFGLSFWRHPFTAEHPLMRHWCRDTFLQIWWRNILILILDSLRVTKLSAHFQLTFYTWNCSNSPVKLKNEHYVLQNQIELHCLGSNVLLNQHHCLWQHPKLENDCKITAILTKKNFNWLLILYRSYTLSVKVLICYSWG